MTVEELLMWMRERNATLRVRYNEESGHTTVTMRSGEFKYETVVPELRIKCARWPILEEVVEHEMDMFPKAKP